MVAWAAQLSRKKVAAICVLILLAGVLAGFLGGRNAEDRLAAQLLEQARRAAAALNGDELVALTGTRADLSNPAYARLKERLSGLQSVIPPARLLSVVRFTPATGEFVFIADSGPAGEAGLQPGDEFSAAARLPALRQAVSTNLASAEGPMSDATGAWAMGFAPLTGAGGPTRDVLDLDVAATGWVRQAWVEGFPCAVYAWIILGLPFGILFVMRGQEEQRKALRNVLGAIEQSPSAVMIVDLDSCIEYVNASLCAQLGYSRRELLGRPWRDFQQKETPAEMLAEMVATVRAGNPWAGEWFNRRRTGELFPVRGAISPVKKRDGTLACFVAVFEDMTDFKRGEAALRSALSRAEAGDRAKSQFLATMSHEVRTPLNGIIGFTSLLLEMPLSPEQEEYIQIIRANGEALIQLTGDILDFAHIESGSLKLDLRPCSPRACVEETLDLLAVQAAGKKVELLHWVEDDVPAAVMADDARLRQVLVNLTGNAVKFTDGGEVEVTVRAEKGAAAGVAAEWLLTFTVRDTGIGIAATDQEKLFKPFNQVDVSTTRRHGGTGLGLAISKNLLQLMGGRISLESGVGRGSTFTFTLPAAAAPALERARPDITGLRIALAAKPGPFRAEFARLARRWHAPLVEVDTATALPDVAWDVALVEADAELAHALAAAAGGRPPAALGVLRELGPSAWPVDKTYAIVPLSLPRELRLVLQGHFHEVINKPLHHDAMLELLAGARPVAAVEERPARFDLNVLVAEDNVVNQRLVQKLLWNLGCTFTVTENGLAVLAELTRAAEQYHLVLMDLHMPEMDGLTAIQKIRSGEAGPHARNLWIAALTADARTEQKERVRAAGGNDYVVKPIKLGELADALRRYVAAHQPPGRS